MVSKELQADGDLTLTSSAPKCCNKQKKTAAGFLPAAVFLYTRKSVFYGVIEPQLAFLFPTRLIENAATPMTIQTISKQ